MMTGPQMATLERLRTGPGRVSLVTATILLRDGLIEVDPLGYRLTERAVTYLIRLENRRLHDLVRDQLSLDDKAWEDRVIAWLDAVSKEPKYTASAGEYQRQRIVGHYAGCMSAGIDPGPPPFECAAETQAWASEYARDIMSVLREYDEKVAVLPKGRWLTVSWGEAGVSVPESRAEAVQGATLGGVTDLRSFRARRGIGVVGPDDKKPA